MDAGTEATINSAVERARQSVAVLEERMKAQVGAATEHARGQARWARTQAALDEKHEVAYVRAVDSLEEQVARQELAKAQLTERGAEDAARNSLDQAELREVRDSVLELRKTLAGMPAAYEAAAGRLAAGRHELDDRNSQYERIGANNAARVQKRQDRISVFERWLGLKVDVEQQADGTEVVRFRLDCIDPSDANAAHTVTLCRASRAKYSVLSSEPRFPGQADVFASFAESQDAARLLRETRSGFRRLYVDDSASG